MGIRSRGFKDDVLVEIVKGMGDIRITLTGTVLVAFDVLLPKGISGATNYKFYKMGQPPKPSSNDD